MGSGNFLTPLFFSGVFLNDSLAGEVFLVFFAGVISQKAFILQPRALQKISMVATGSILGFLLRYLHKLGREMIVPVFLTMSF